MSQIIPLSVAGPVNLEATVRLLQRRPANLIDRWEDGRYLRLIRTVDGPRLVAVSNDGTIDAPDLRMTVLREPVTDEAVRQLSQTVRWMLGLDVDSAPAERLATLEPRLSPTLERLRGFRPPCFPDLFTTCVGVLPFQQLSLDAGIAILGRLVQRLGPSVNHAGRTWHDLPSPDAIADASLDDLVAIGLSRSKAASLHALAEAVLSGALDAARLRHLSTADAMSELQRFPGIGPWSAGLILLRGLRRMDVFPAGDSGAARSLTALLGLSTRLTPAETDRIADRFGECRGYLYYLCLGSRLPG